MTSLRASGSYVWSTSNILGKGATGAVYQGVNKTNGELVAVKTFNPLSHMRPHEVQVREFDVLEKVNHDNIVKLLAIEKELETQSKVLVMELCTGGSLFNILDDPENSYGVEETEFLLVLKHLSAGMKYLRDMEIVHRDLKPGNIMKYISEEGRSIYKLTDFGAARELKDDQQFISLYGTEEYLHPYMYERAVLRKPIGQAFGASVDLWSIGVTLYHVATGSLPFRPFGGRKNRETMHFMTTKKESGVISGSQTSENGPIEWGWELPSTCQLSTGLRHLVTPLLAGLMECDTSKMWTFGDFFDNATAMLERREVYVFDVHRARLLTVFAQQEDTVAQLKSLVRKQTEVAAEDQILLACVGERWLTDTVKVPQTKPLQPVFFWRRSATEVSVPEETQIPRFPSLPTAVDLEKDANIAKQSCSVAHFVKRLVEKYVQAYTLIGLAAQEFESVTTELYSQLLKDVTQLMTCSAYTVQKMKMLQSRQKSTCQLLEIINSQDPLLIDEKNKLQMLVNSKKESNITVNKQLTVVKSRIEEEHDKLVVGRNLHEMWQQVIDGMPDLARCPHRAATYVQKMRDSWQHLVKDRSTQRTFSFHDEQFHTLEKVKIQETSQKLLRLFKNECFTTVRKLAPPSSEWFSHAQCKLSQANCLQEEMTNFSEMVNAHDATLDEANDTYDQSLQTIADRLQVNPPVMVGPTGEVQSVSPKRREMKSMVAKQLLDGLYELSMSHKEIANMMNESQSLMAQLQDSSAALTENLASMSLDKGASS